MPFSNSILAGETLVRQAMQSEGFVSGTEGWRVTREGDSEFNDVVIRGTIEATNGEGEKVYMAVSQFTGDPFIGFQVDNSDVGFIAGEVYNTNQDAIVTSIDGGSVSHRVVENAWALAGNGNGLLYDDADEVLHFAEHSSGGIANMVKEPWEPITMQNSWTPRSAFYEPSTRINPLGHVELYGTFTKVGGGANGTNFGLIAAKFRPPCEVILPLATNNGNTYSFIVRPDGLLRLLHSQGASPTFSTISVSGSYPLNFHPDVTP